MSPKRNEFSKDNVYVRTKTFILAILLTLITTFFGIHFLIKANHELLIYVVVIFIASVIIIKTHRKVHYPFLCFVGLSIWAILHLADGGIIVSGDIL
ncbi:MAG: hypothetical protein Q4C95_02385 [Planctomycetia bacterium]|nr:hypothetical protein [Planctomycetia bacterium]